MKRPQTKGIWLRPSGPGTDLLHILSWPGWTRTTTAGSKDRCPAIRRRAIAPSHQRAGAAIPTASPKRRWNKSREDPTPRRAPSARLREAGVRTLAGPKPDGRCSAAGRRVVHQAILPGGIPVRKFGVRVLVLPPAASPATLFRHQGRDGRDRELPDRDPPGGSRAGDHENDRVLRPESARDGPRGFTTSAARGRACQPERRDIPPQAGRDCLSRAPGPVSAYG